MPRQATELEERLDEVSLPEETLKPTLPIIRARVVYLGAMRNKSVCLPGQIMVTYIEAPDGAKVRKDRETGKEGRYDEIKEAVDTGLTSYDFSTHDARGRIIRERMMDKRAPERMQGKPFNWVEHVDHLRHFFMARGADGEREFEVLVKPEQQAGLQDHIRRTMRGRRQQDDLFKEIVGG